MSSGSKQSKTIYLPDCPPPSLAEARARIDELVADMVKIDTDLEKRHFIDFDGDEQAFLDWRRRACNSLAYKKQECTFLRGWLRENTDWTDLPPNETLFLTLLQIKCEEIPSEFPVVFTTNVQPQSQHDTAKRRDEIIARLQQYEKWFIETTSEAFSMGINGRYVSHARRTATDHIAKLQQELVLLKKWLHLNPPRARKSSAHGRTLLTIIERAIARGINLELSEDEYASLDFFRSQI